MKQLPGSTQVSEQPELSAHCLLKAKRSLLSWQTAVVTNTHMVIQGPRESISEKLVTTTAHLISDSSSTHYPGISSDGDAQRSW